MKTPFDAVLRIASREVVAMRSAVGVAAGQLAQCEASRAAAAAAHRTESRLAATDWSMVTDGYFAAAAARRACLEADSAQAGSRLDAVRRAAVEAYGSLRAVETAVERFGAEADLRRRTAEQAVIDDFIGARFARTLPRRRPLRPRGSAGGMA